jgi:hypothetical protein
MAIVMAMILVVVFMMRVLQRVVEEAVGDVSACRSVAEDPFATESIEAPACKTGVSSTGCFVAPCVGPAA